MRLLLSIFRVWGKFRQVCRMFTDSAFVTQKNGLVVLNAVTRSPLPGGSREIIYVTDGGWVSRCAGAELKSLIEAGGGGGGGVATPLRVSINLISN